MKIQKRCVVCRKVPIKPNYLLSVDLSSDKKDFYRSVCRVCSVRIHKKLIEDSIKRKQEK